MSEIIKANIFSAVRQWAVPVLSTIWYIVEVIDLITIHGPDWATTGGVIVR